MRYVAKTVSFGLGGPTTLHYHKKEPFDQFDIQARAYMALLQLGYDVRGEYSLTDVKFFDGVGQVRFDMVIFHEKRPLALVIVKREGSWGEDTRQRRRYSSFEVPIYVLSDVEDITEMCTHLAKTGSLPVEVPSWA